LRRPASVIFGSIFAIFLFASAHHGKNILDAQLNDLISDSAAELIFI